MGTPLVLLIAYHFPPDSEIGGARPYRFYKYLKRLGYECHVITAARQAEDAAEDVEYVADPQDGKYRKGLARQLERAGRKLLWGTTLKPRWTLSALKAGRSFLKQRDNQQIVILSSAPPAATHLVAMGLVAFTDLKWIADFRDPVTPLPGALTSLQGSILRSIVRLVMKRADFALANTDAMQRAWSHRYLGIEKKSLTLWNGFDAEDEIATYALPQRDRKVLSHVGELYGGRNIRAILHGVARLLEGNRLQQGSILVRQIGVANKEELPDSEFLQKAQTEGWFRNNELVSPKEARSLALESDGLLLIQPQSTVQVPAKLFEYLRVGRPILAYVVRHSPTMRILQQAGVPFECIFPEDSPEQVEQRLLSFIEMLDGQPVTPSKWFADNFDGARQVRALDALIQSLAAEEWPAASESDDRRKRILDGAPWALRLGRWMSRSGIRGGYRLISLARRGGHFDVIARYRLNDLNFHTPLYREDSCWDERDVKGYEERLVTEFCRAAGGWPELTLFDCGADIGIFSALFVARSSNVSHVLAFEPNSEVQDVLRMNLASLNIPAIAIPKAVSSFTGKGILVRPPHESSDHARYLAPCDGDGEIDVLSIDSLGVFAPNVAIKIDVEGGEAEVLKGAERTIRQARNCVISLEANPRVARRIGHDPSENLRFLSTIRNFSFLIAETGEYVSPERNLLSADQEDIWNIVACTREN